MFRLSRIMIYPIKSLDGVALAEVGILSTGALVNDRRFAIRNSRGEWVNGKANARVHLLRASFSPDMHEVALTPSDGGCESFNLQTDRAKLESWLSDFFHERVIVAENSRAGFPDDTDSPGPTLTSGQTMDAIAGWFTLPAEEVRKRFRANLEIEGDAPFCEDRLVADSRHVVRFAVGSVVFEGVTPCQRCVVPTRNPVTAEAYPHFARQFSARREEQLPAWAMAERFDHFYRLAVNTRLSPTSAAGAIRVGDEVRILEVVCA
jgi:uncharacterized protein YcbX